MKKKPLMGLVLTASVLLVLSGLYTNCQPLGEITGEASVDQSSNNPDEFVLPPEGAPLNKAQDLWVNTVEPLFRANCVACHDIPFQAIQRGNTPAPLTIYLYDQMKPLVAEGPTGGNNPLINKMKNIVAHGGGVNSCPGDINGSESPCREVKEWALAEYPLATDGKAGVVTRVDLQGRIQGWLLDPENINQAVNAIFYIDGPVDVGTEIGNILANGAGLGVNENGHYFNFQLPDVYRDGVARDLYIYADTAVADNLIPLMPERVQGFVPQEIGQPGRDIYENQLKPRLTACMNCHQVDYGVHWFQVGNPLPAKGGSPTNNELIDYMNGQNDHSGGSFCGGNKNNQPCASVQAWWTAEFGS